MKIVYRSGQSSASKQETSPTSPSRYEYLYAPPVTKLPAVLSFLLIIIVLYVGWQIRDEKYIVAESGIGYALGIVGSVMMLMLLLYPLRKRVRFMKRWGKTRYWFIAHLTLGALGPVFILFHSNFNIGSMNSSVALMSTLLVALSGFVGLNIYRKIHYSLFSKRATLKELQEGSKINRDNLSIVFDYAPKLQHQILTFEAAALTPSYNIMQSIWRLLIIGVWTQWTHIILLLWLRRALRVAARHAGWSAAERKRQSRIARRHLSVHLITILKTAEFSFYERLFAFWYIFHLPLLLLLVIAATFHVFAVHMY